MKTFRFRNFPVYNDARAFRKKILEILKKIPPSEKYRLIDQIHRSCLSVILNIAEGSAKHSDMAIASVNEVIAGLDVASDDGYLNKEAFVAIEQDAEHLAKQLGGFIKKLRTPSIVKS